MNSLSLIFRYADVRGNQQAGLLSAKFCRAACKQPISIPNIFFGAMVSPFRYNEGVTIYINGERIVPGLLMIDEQNDERSVATEDEQRLKSSKKNIPYLPK